MCQIDRLFKLTWLAPILIATLLGACKTDEVFEDLGGRLAGPSDVASFGKYFYALNSDFDRRFNKGSILVIDPDEESGSEKKAIVEVPRLGRTLFVDEPNALMVVTFDREENERPGLVQLRSITDGGLSIPVQKSWEVDCNPLNAILSTSASYIAVSCIGGDLYVGDIDTANPAQSNLQRVRDYNYPRRALHIHEEGDKAILFAFATDIADQNIQDSSYTDAKFFTSSLLDSTETLQENGDIKLNEGANEVPDTFEDSLGDIRRQAARFPYQYVIYNLSAEKEKGYPFVEIGNILSPSQANLELKFMYYTLNLKNGTAESPDQVNDQSTKFYRSNFWATTPDLDEPNVFYLSQRSIANSFIFGNDVLKVRVDASAIGSLPDNLPPTSNILEFERAFGFTEDNPILRNYPGDIELFYQNGEKILLVNHFRDAVYWSPTQQRFSIDAVSLAAREQSSTNFPVKSDEQTVAGADFDQSYYQIAVNNQGVVMSCSFYGDSLLLVDVGANAALTLRRQIF